MQRWSAALSLPLAAHKHSLGALLVNGLAAERSAGTLGAPAGSNNGTDMTTKGLLPGTVQPTDTLQA